MSQTVDKNCNLVTITEKKLISHGGTASALNARESGGNAMTTKDSFMFNRWKLYKCAECQVWTYAHNEQESRFALLLNNRVKERQSSRLGLLSVSQDKESGVRVPILEKIKLKIPF